MRRDEGKKVDIKRFDDICVCSKLPFDNHHSDTTLPLLCICASKLVRARGGERWERGEFETIQLSVGLILN